MARIKRKNWLAAFEKKRARAVIMYAEGRGRTQEEIAEHFGVTRQRVGQWLKLQTAKAAK